MFCTVQLTADTWGFRVSHSDRLGGRVARGLPPTAIVSESTTIQ